MKFLLASSNIGKAQELLGSLGDLGIEIETAQEVLDVEETGTTFTENALIKAKAYFDHYKTPTIADDSGLVVDAIPGELGVYSARFADHLKTYTEKCRYLLNRLEETKANTRKASFVSVLCFYFGPQEYFFFEGNLAGSLGFDLKGEEGFGYDPIFVPEEQSFTLAENSSWKRENSHRARALKSAKLFLRGYLSS